MDLELTGKIAVVTGAGKGIGLATTRALVAEGAHVVAGSRTIETMSRRSRLTSPHRTARPGSSGGRWTTTAESTSL